MGRIREETALVKKKSTRAEHRFPRGGGDSKRGGLMWWNIPCYSSISLLTRWKTKGHRVLMAFLSWRGQHGSSNQLVNLSRELLITHTHAHSSLLVNLWVNRDESLPHLTHQPWQFYIHFASLCYCLPPQTRGEGWRVFFMPYPLNRRPRKWWRANQIEISGDFRNVESAAVESF